MCLNTFFSTKLMFFKVYGNVNGNKMIVNVQKNICLDVIEINKNK